MKHLKFFDCREFLLAAITLLCQPLFAQDFSAGINVDNPNPNAVLHLVSPNGNQGLLIPQLTTAQRTGMTLGSADNGLMVYDSTEQDFFFWNGSGWVRISTLSAQNIGQVLSQGNDAGGVSITNVADPSNPQDVATKNYVDNFSSFDPASSDAGNVLIEGTDGKIFLGSIDDADPDPSNEIQDLNDVLIQGADAGGLIISNAADPTVAQDVATKNYVDTQGFISSEGDGSVTNEIQDLTSVLTQGADAGGFTITNAADPALAQDVATKNYVDTQGFVTGEIQDLSSVLSFGNNAGGLIISNVADPTAAQDVATRNYVESQGYLTTELDGSVTNEIQDLASVLAQGTNAGGVAITNVANPTAAQDVATRNYVDTQGFLTAEVDGSTSNEIQDLASVLAQGNNAGGVAITNVANPTAAQDVATRDYVDTQGFLTAEVDGSISNEIQDLASVLAQGTNAGGVAITNVANPTAAQDVATRDYVDTQGFLTAEVDGSISNEIQDLASVLAQGTNAGGVAITNVANPTAAQDVATRDYVDTQGFLTAEVDGSISNEIQDLASVLAQGTNAGGVAITNVANPTAAQDVATRDYVDTQGFLTAEVDGSISNEIQDLASVLAQGTNAGGVAITNVANPTAAQDVATRDYVDTQGFLTAEVDGSISNEIQDLANVLAQGASAGGVAITNVANPTAAQDVATRDYVDTQGFLTTEVDGSISNEIQDLASVLAQGTNAGGVAITNVANPTAAQDVATRDYVDTQGFLTAEVDGSISNEIQDLASVLAQGTNAGGVAITNVANPTAAQDVATRDYVDTQGFITGEIQDLSSVLSFGNSAGATVISNLAEPTAAQDAATRNYVDTQGFITGEIQDLADVLSFGNDAGTSVISNVGEPAAAQDAATRNYVDTQGFITGEIQDLADVLSFGNDAGTSVISNVGEPAAAQDAATRNYVDTQGFITGEIQDLADVLSFGNDAGTSVISNVGEPAAAQDAATRNYVDTQGFITGEIQDLADVLSFGNDAGASVISNLAEPAAAQDAATRNYVDTQGFITGEIQDLADVLSFGNDAGGTGITNLADVNVTQTGAGRAALFNVNNVSHATAAIEVFSNGGAGSSLARFDRLSGTAGTGVVIDMNSSSQPALSILTSDAPFYIPNASPAAGDVLTSDGSGNITLEPGFGTRFQTTNYLAVSSGGAANIALGATNNLVIGNTTAQSLTTGDDNVALGALALITVTTGTDNIGIGTGSGGGTLSTGVGNIFIGSGAILSPGNPASGGNIAIGNGAQVQNGNSIALGAGANGSAPNSVAIGGGATASNSGSVAIGNGASATLANTVTIGNPGGTLYDLEVSGDMTVGGVSTFDDVTAEVQGIHPTLINYNNTSPFGFSHILNIDQNQSSSIEDEWFGVANTTLLTDGTIVKVINTSTMPITFASGGLVAIPGGGASYVLPINGVITMIWLAAENMWYIEE